MKAAVDQDLCISCGLCLGMEPSVFRFNDDGKSEAYADVAKEEQEEVQAAIDACPTDAISWTEH